jgi:hypothetical protein
VELSLLGRLRRRGLVSRNGNTHSCSTSSLQPTIVIITL